MRVEVTLKSGVTVTGYATTFETTSDMVQGAPRKATWEGPLKVGVPAFRYINLEEVAAVVIFPEASDLGTPRPGKSQ
jgi:hypothetical protein